MQGAPTNGEAHVRRGGRRYGVRSTSWRCAHGDGYRFGRAGAEGPGGPLVRAAPLRGFHQVSATSTELVARYWDTEDRALARRGHTLRHRVAADGTERTWTLKLSGHGSSSLVAVSSTSTVTTRPRRARRWSSTRGLVGRSPLREIAVVHTERTTMTLRDEAEVTVEVADDVVALHPGRGGGPSFREIEVELVEGDDAVLERFAAVLLTSAGGGRPDPTPKLVRVLGVVPAAEPLSSRPKTVAALVAGAIGLATEQLLAHDPLIRLDAAAEDIHKARVATRRLRSDLKTLEPWCDAFRVEGLRQELRWLGELLGNVRDADVLPLTIATRAEQLADVDRDAVAIILARLAEDRRRALAVLRDVMGSARYLGLIADLERLAQQPPLRPEVDPELAASKVGRRGLAHAVGRVRKRIERLPADAGLEPLHEIRKAAKRARYAAELTSVLSRGRTDDAADRLADLQDQLGAMQDAVTAHQWLVGQRWPDADWQVAFTAGRLAQSFAADMAVAPTGWRRTWHRATDKHASRWYR
ncbi:MAG: CYTH and CHAD domain-containing protein [Acidimicrobiales bacterium]